MAVSPGATPPPVNLIASPSPTVPPTYSPGAFVDQPAWRVNLPGTVTPFAVLVIDPAGRLTGVAPAAARYWTAATFKNQVLPGRDDRSIDVYWSSGAACDGWETVTLGSDNTMTLVATPVDTPCDPGHIIRGFELRFRDKVDAARFTLVSGPPARYPPAQTEAGVAFSDAQHGTIALANGRVGVEDTSDGGITWRITDIGDGVPTGIALAGDTTWLAVSCDPSQWDHCAAGVWRRDHGTWSHTLAMDPGPMAVSDGTIAVVEQPLLTDSTGFTPDPTGIRITYDNGARWSHLDTPCTSPDARLTGIALNRGHTPLVICEGDSATGQADKRLFTYDGPSGGWVELAKPPAAGHDVRLSMAPFTSLALLPPLPGLLWGERSPLLTTSDGGVTWTAHRDVADGDVRVVQAGDAWAPGGGVILVYDPDRSARLLLVSTDGKTWTEITAFRELPCCGG
jgi:hypothetical protein